MMQYEKRIMSWLIDSYEKRDPNSATVRKIVLSVSKKFPDYKDPMSEVHDEVEEAIHHLQSWGFVQSTENSQGYFERIILTESALPEIYEFLHRTPKGDLREKQKKVLEAFAAKSDGVTKRFCKAMLDRLVERKELEYGLAKDIKILEDVLIALLNIERLKKETYIRNFSEMVFHDSKRVQQIINPITNILFDYGDTVTEKETVLAQHNLISNPAYVYLKGDWEITCHGRCITVDMFNGGIAISSDALGEIERIAVPGGKVISVENLTTYHDTKECQGAIIYLGGFMNTVRADFLKKVYCFEPNAVYLHKGDLDPYGFVILENLKQKTGIPFVPLEMDLGTLKKCYAAGHFRALSESDRKIIASEELGEYQTILQYMSEHNCKIEQECFEAMRLESDML